MKGSIALTCLEQKSNDEAPAETPAESDVTLNENEKPKLLTPPTKAADTKEHPEYKELLELLDKSDAALRALAEERDRLRNQLDHERGESAKYQKDNTLLRSEIVEMTRAREPLREESFFVGQFNEIAADIESWAARETRKAKLEKLSKKETGLLKIEFPKYGPYGVESGKWFGKQSSEFATDRRNRIALIRHAVAVVLVDRVFDRYIFAFSREFTWFFSEMEMSICMNGTKFSALWLIL
jgi:hypothetical protein